MYAPIISSNLSFAVWARRACVLCKDCKSAICGVDDNSTVDVEGVMRMLPCYSPKVLIIDNYLRATVYFIMFCNLQNLDIPAVIKFWSFCRRKKSNSQLPVRMCCTHDDIVGSNARNEVSLQQTPCRQRRRKRKKRDGKKCD